MEEKINNNAIIHIVICNTKYEDGTNEDTLMRIYSTADKAIKAKEYEEERAKEKGFGDCKSFRVESWMVW
jgi:hypothetical protein